METKGERFTLFSLPQTVFLLISLESLSTERDQVKLDQGEAEQLELERRLEQLERRLE